MNVPSLSVPHRSAAAPSGDVVVSSRDISASNLIKRSENDLLNHK